MVSKELKNILLVEDEPDIQKIARVSLEQVGNFKVTVCSSGHEALEVTKSFLPDLFLLDVMMPGMDGPTTLKRLRENDALKEIPVIFITAKAQPSEVNEFLSMGAIDVITKPFNPMTLAETITGCWNKHL